MIKEADKGSAVVIMDSYFYKEHIINMLSNTVYYKEIEDNDDKKTMQKIKKKYVKTTQNNIQFNRLTDKEEDYLTKFEFRESNFYGLPKVHK